MVNHSISILILGLATLFSLLGIIYRSMIKKIETLDIKKVDKDLYKETLSHLQKAVDGINGTAATLKTVVDSISNIQEEFLTLKEHNYMCRLRHSSQLLEHDGDDKVTK
jgi:hypothetical protein